MRSLPFILLLLCLVPGRSQDVPLPIRQADVYGLLREYNVFSEGSIQMALAPLSEKKVYEALCAADSITGLTPRLRKEIEALKHRLAPAYAHPETSLTYPRSLFTSFGKGPLQGYNEDLFFYRDTLFSFRLRPLLSYEMYSNEAGTESWRRSGLAFTATAGRHWGFWGSLEDNAESLRLAEDEYLTRRPGGNFKWTGQGGEYSEARAGLSYAWDWGNVMMAKDHIRWGSGYHGSSILSGRTPSFPWLGLYLAPVKWLEFQYFHGWLISEVIDSSRTAWYTNAFGKERREHYFGKYIAANLFTLKPWKQLHFSFGNSIVYSDDLPRFTYFIPFLFFKSVDHTLSGAGSNRVGQNAQMFFDIQTWQFGWLHAYTSLFVDEVSLGNFWDREKQSNHLGMKIGLAVYDLPVAGLRSVAEYTRNLPMAYRHNTPVTTFESNRYNLGHYLSDNADELYLSLRWAPLPFARLEASYTLWRKGPDYTAEGTARTGLPFMEEEVLRMQEYKLQASYRILAHLKLFGSLAFSDAGGEGAAHYLPAFYRGKKTTATMGVGWFH
jgi:hypothetical protein